MHRATFSVKRVHLRTVELLKPLAAMFKLTPARFDMLYALWTRWKKHLHTTQRDLQAILGVCAATVSRMAQSLEKLGLITREEFSMDRRKVLVGFTRKGLARFESAYDELVDPRTEEGLPATPPTAYVIESYVTTAPYEMRTALFLAFEDALQRARRGVVDTATLRYT
jgi:DNA-binding MarR family transcriptional regulator